MMNPDLLRQRRNLIAVSGVLLIFDFAQVTIGKVSVLGTELLIGNAQVLIVSAWTFWAYFILRYYQYWRAEPDRHIRDSFMNRLNKYACSYTKAREQDEIGQASQYRFCRVGLAKWFYVDSQYAPERGDVVEGLGMHLPLWRLVVWSVMSAIFVGIKTPYATDHVLPFALALAAPVTTLFTKW